MDDPGDDIFEILCQRVTAAPETDMDPLTPRTVSIASGVCNSSVADDQDNAWWQPIDLPSHDMPCSSPGVGMGVQAAKVKSDDTSEDESDKLSHCVSRSDSLDQTQGTGIVQNSSDEASDADGEPVPPPIPPENPYPDLPPLRALSAYNFFFRDERERLLYGGELCLDSMKCHALLTQHWTRDRTQKRRHRKTHGKIPFTELSKIVSRKWKELDESQKNFYRRVSSLDWERYQKDLEDYKSRQQQQEEDQTKEESEDEVASDNQDFQYSSTSTTVHDGMHSLGTSIDADTSQDSNGLETCSSLYSDSTLTEI